MVFRGGFVLVQPGQSPSKDCLEDLRVYFTQPSQQIVDNAQSIKCRRVEVLNVFMDVESVPFNKGFYSVDMTYYFLVTADVFSSPVTPPAAVQGVAVFSKKVILYGSEGSVKTFSSGRCDPGPDDCSADCPAAKVQVVDPIILSCRLCDSPSPGCDCAVSIPPEHLRAAVRRLRGPGGTALRLRHHRDVLHRPAGTGGAHDDPGLRLLRTG